MRTNKTLFTTVALAVLAATSLAVSAQERITTPATTQFVSHPTYCAQWVGGVERENDSVSSAMLQSLVQAVVSLKYLPSQVAIVEVTDMCKEKLRGAATLIKQTAVL